MIEVLKKQGIVSLNEEVRGQDKTQVAYENLLKMFKVFELNDDDRSVLIVLSLMPLSGVDVKDLRNWMGVQALRSLRNLESRSWVAMSSNGIALHPIIRDVVRHELPYTDAEAKPFLDAFNETVKEEKSWHYPIGIKSYYADICSEIISMFKEINENTLQLYKNIELLFSFGVKPGQAIEIGTRLFKYHAEKEANPTATFEGLTKEYSYQFTWIIERDGCENPHNVTINRLYPSNPVITDGTDGSTINTCDNKITLHAQDFDVTEFHDYGEWTVDAGNSTYDQSKKNELEMTFNALTVGNNRFFWTIYSGEDATCYRQTKLNVVSNYIEMDPDPAEQTVCFSKSVTEDETQHLLLTGTEKATNEIGDGWGAYDCGLSNCYLVLKARAMGFDTLIMGMRDAEGLRKLFDIPESEAVMAVISLGYRDSEPTRPERRPFGEIVKFF